MSATGDHDSGELAHSVMLREGIRSWIDWVLGAGHRRAIFVHVMPEASTVDTWTEEEHKTRDRSFGLATLFLALAGMAFLTLVGILMNLFISWRKKRRKTPEDRTKKSFGVTLIDKSKDTRERVVGNAVPGPVPATPRQGPTEPLLVRSKSEDDRQADDEEDSDIDIDDFNNGEFKVEDVENSDAEDELEAAKLRVVGYDSKDLYFSVYHTLYCVGCLVVTGYAVLNDYLSKHFGLDYEFYILWVLYIIFLHFACLCRTFKHAVRIGEDVPTCLMAIPKSFIPSDGHLGVLRDAVTAGIYAQEFFKRGGWDAVVLATITLVSTTCIFLPNVWIFRDVYPLRDFQECYWPIVIQADRRFSQLKRDVVPDKRGFIERNLAPIKDFWARPDKRKWCTQLVLKFLDESTRQHKQATSLLGDLPQVFCGTTFLVRFSKPKSALFVFLATLIALFKTILVLFLRAPTLCLMASYEVEWSHLTATDIRQGTIKFWLVKWILQSAACRLLLKNPETTMDARIEALRSLHKLHHLNSQNEGKRKDLKKEEMASEEEERMEARHAVLWEVAQQPDPRIQRIAKDFLDHDNKEKTDWKTAAMQFRRLEQEVPSEKMEAMKLLTRDFPHFSPAYAKNLLEDLSRRTTKPLNRVSADAQVVDIDGGDGGQNCCCACLLSGIVAAEQDCWNELCCCCPWGKSSGNEEATDCAEEAADQDNLAFAKEWRSMREVRYASAKALADLAVMSKHREGDKKDKKNLTENQRSMALRAIKSIAPAVVERLDSNNAEISSAALVAVVAFRSQEEIEMAVKKAVEILKGKTKGMRILQRNRGEPDCRHRLHKMKEEKRKTAELVLVQLLPELNLKSENETPTDSLKGQEYWLDQIVACGFDSKWARKSEAATSRRVLERLGGRTAGLAKERLLKRSDLDLHGKDLLQVLEAQDKDLQDMNGDWRLCRSMNLNLAPVGSVKSSLTESDLQKIAAGEEIFEVLGKKSLAYHITTQDDPDPNRPEDDDVTHVLPVFFSDLEPDDTMFIAEMWKFLRKEESETHGKRICCEPMVIFATDPAGKDIGMIFEKKLTLAALVLGKVDYRVVTPSPKATKTAQANKDGKDGTDGGKDGKGKDSDKKDEKVDVDPKKVSRLMNLRDRNIKAIQERLRRFRGHVDFFVCAPGRGNLGEIVFGPNSSDKGFRNDLLKGKTFSVALYSGQFNVKNMEEDDLEGVLNLLEHEDKKEGKKEGKKDGEKEKPNGERGKPDSKKRALMDISKFPFWGGPEAHPATDGLSTFALPSFAPAVKCKYPEIAYLWSSFNDEFNCKLIHFDKLFANAILGQNVEATKAEIKGLYERKEITKYARRILNDDELFKQVENRKRLTVKNFAYGCCDAPLCDQLIFVERWASVYQQFSRLWADQEEDSWEPSWVRTVKGKWHFDKRLNHTNVDPKSTLSGAPNGAQPEIQFSCNVMAIYKISEALQDYTLGHLQDLRTEKFKLTPHEAKQIKVIN